MKKESDRLEKKIRVLLSPEAKEYFKGLSEKAQKKFDVAIKKTQEGFSGDWFKKLTGTDDIYEFSADADNHFYRLFAFWDKRGKEETLIVCTHGIEKKSNKTPTAAKKKAEKMKKEWLATPR